MSGFTKKINNDIKESKLIVIDSTGKNLGQVTRSVAIAKAKEQNLDLVLISSSDNEKNKLPVAKIIDYKKFLYNQKIKEKQARKNQEIITVKEIKIRPQIGNHDLMWRAKNAIDWLQKNYQIKFKIQAFGRIGTKKEIIEEVYQKFLSLLEGVGTPLAPLKQTSHTGYEATIVKTK